MIYQYRRKETITVTAGRKKKVIIGILVALCMTVTGCAGSVKKGTKYLEEKDYKNAEVEFQDAVDKKKNLGEAYRGLGLCYWEQKKYEKAEKALEKALKNGTEETATLYNILGSAIWNWINRKRQCIISKMGRSFQAQEKSC